MIVQITRSKNTFASAVVSVITLFHTEMSVKSSCLLEK